LPHAFEIAKQAIISEKCVVVCLQATGESQTLELIKNEGQISDFFSTTNRVLQKDGFCLGGREGGSEILAMEKKNRG
jgi:hypothetical protein